MGYLKKAEFWHKTGNKAFFLKHVIASVARQRQSAEPPPRRRRVRRTSTPMAVCPSIRDLLFCGSQHRYVQAMLTKN